MAGDEGVAGVTELSAHFGVEGGFGEDEVGVLLGFDDVDECGLRGELFVAEEDGGRDLGGVGAFGGGDDDGLLGGGLAACALDFHLLVEICDVDSEPLFGCEQLCHVERETVSVVELESENPWEYTFPRCVMNSDALIALRIQLDVVKGRFR